MTSPLDDALNMEAPDAKERATNTGLEMAAGGAMSAIAIFIGSRLMNSGDFTTPFFIMAAGAALSTVLYWFLFRPLEISQLSSEAPADRDLRDSIARGGRPAVSDIGAD